MQDDIRANVGDKLAAGFVIANVQFMADRANDVGIGDFVPVAEARDEQAAQSTGSAGQQESSFSTRVRGAVLLLLWAR